MAEQAVRDIRLDLTRKEYQILVKNTIALQEIYAKALKKIDNQEAEMVALFRENFDSVETFYAMLENRVIVIDDPK